MTLLHDTLQSEKQPSRLPQGQILKGRYSDVLRSEKGKLKGLQLQIGEQELAIKLPKYLRPMLVRELEIGAYIQVWAYPDGAAWYAINILPLPAQEVKALGLDELPTLNKQEQRPWACIHVCRKGTCHKRGSGELWQALHQEIEVNPEFKGVEIAATGCLKACKQGPNLRLAATGEVINWARPQDAPAVLTHACRQTNSST
jgi:(2Fe-2S) ferredoxin